VIFEYFLTLLLSFNVFLGIEEDSDDFEDDPVLISLREQRRRYIAELL